MLRRAVRQTLQGAFPTIHRAHCRGLLDATQASSAHRIPSFFRPAFRDSAVREELFMNTNTHAHPSWNTASFGDAADTSPMELSALGAHLDLCKGSRGRLFTLHCAAETMNAFVVPRFVTTLVVVSLFIGACSLVL
jgi:hypothetical protein